MASVLLQVEPPFHAERTNIPGWVLQAHVDRPLLIGDRKFHARVYVLLLETGTVYVHNRVDYRAASAAYDATDFSSRDAHITNGAGKADVHSGITSDLPELAPFTESLIEFSAAIALNCQACAVSEPTHVHARTDEYALLAFDIMIDALQRLWLLKLNHNPAVPEQQYASTVFWDHLIGLCQDMLTVLTNGVTCSCSRVQAQHTQFRYMGTRTDPLTTDLEAFGS